LYCDTPSPLLHMLHNLHPARYHLVIWLHFQYCPS
jgi:hypothetical protein